jgi:Flp pilus assembly pilin Flp
MKNSMSQIKKRYAAMTEYIIILALVAIGSIAVFNIFGDQIRSVVGASAQQMSGEKDAEPENMLDDLDSATESKSMSNF